MRQTAWHPCKGWAEVNERTKTKSQPVACNKLRSMSYTDFYLNAKLVLQTVISALPTFLVLWNFNVLTSELVNLFTCTVAEVCPLTCEVLMFRSLADIVANSPNPV